MKKWIVWALMTWVLTGCTMGMRVYYWEVSDPGQYGEKRVGGTQFVRDHNACLRKSDYWPFEFWPFSKTSIFQSPETLDLKLNLKEGIWANFSPYEGSMPIFVNDAHPSITKFFWRYSLCMKMSGYKERMPYKEHF
ncbi:MAG: hypothetical protein MJ250_08000 [Alphaproteobacteria bacterium]|nr:hypothetical protein [Alphaproteobacteria bacterium]